MVGIEDNEEVVEDTVKVVNAVEATTDWPFMSKILRLLLDKTALETLKAGSVEDPEEPSELEDLEDNDSMSMSTQVAVKVEVVPKRLRPLSSGSYNVVGGIFGLSGVRTTLGTESEEKWLWLLLLLTFL